MPKPKLKYIGLCEPNGTTRLMGWECVNYRECKMTIPWITALPWHVWPNLRTDYPEFAARVFYGEKNPPPS